MVRILFAVTLAVGLVFATATLAPAARDISPVSTQPTAELVMFEVAGCYVCEAMRQRNLPAIQASAAGRGLTIRVVDLNAPVAETFKLAGPITLLPTLVMIEDGRELARLEGYFGQAVIDRFVESRRLLPR